ncbi:MAG: hypothetical protein J2P36_31115 [Ktedonobacteraceae bacterium]|nr:hypothetical protein [Ktedonobacteraceae bacterium]
MRRPLVQTANAAGAATAARSGRLRGIACGGAGKDAGGPLLFRSATLLAQLRLRRQPSREAAALLHLPLRSSSDV